MNRPEPITGALHSSRTDWSMRLFEYAMCGLAVLGALLLGVAR